MTHGIVSVGYEGCAIEDFIADLVLARDQVVTIRQLSAGNFDEPALEPGVRQSAGQSRSSPSHP
jgi:hypothetical protein